jgi:hypothetical protein
MRMIVMLAAVLSLALSAPLTESWAWNRVDGSDQKALSASAILLTMIRHKSAQMACADAGLSCSRDSDCCPGNFCAGDGVGKRACIKI